MIFKLSLPSVPNKTLGKETLCNKTFGKDSLTSVKKHSANKPFAECQK
jgi:hypothetical protein